MHEPALIREVSSPVELFVHFLAVSTSLIVFRVFFSFKDLGCETHPSLPRSYFSTLSLCFIAPSHLSLESSFMCILYLSI